MSTMKSEPDTRRLTEERIDGFKNLVVGHPALKEAYSQLEAAALTPSNTSLVIISGPTGVGKTTLVHL